MRYLKRIVIGMLMLIATGCATAMPQGPSVIVLPTQGKPFTKFQEEDADCRKWAEKSTGISPAEAKNQSTLSGAAIGSVLGAGAGALLGSVSGNVGAGAAVGAGAGMLMGTAVGSDAGKVSAAEAQRRYDLAYSQCMSSYGNQISQPAVPEPRHYHRQRVIVVPAEQPPVYYALPPPPVYQTAPVYQQPPPPPASSAPVYPPQGTPPPAPEYSTSPPNGTMLVPSAGSYYPSPPGR